MNEGYEAYKKYLSVKLHFTKDEYDFFKYNGEINAKYLKSEGTSSFGPIPYATFLKKFFIFNIIKKLFYFFNIVNVC